MGHLNVEIKASCRNQADVSHYLRTHGAEFKGVDHQIDTYFAVPHGRLKLRQGNVENSLIYYDRPDIAGPKESRIALYQAPDLASLLDVLTLALPVRIIVDKQREIVFMSNVKFHLDTVVGLGQFVEIEAIDYDGTIGRDQLYMQCRHYMHEFGIQDEDLLDVSYSDLLLKQNAGSVASLQSLHN